MLISFSEAALQNGLLSYNQVQVDPNSQCLAFSQDRHLILDTTRQDKIVLLGFYVVFNLMFS